MLGLQTFLLSLVIVSAISYVQASEYKYRFSTTSTTTPQPSTTPIPLNECRGRKQSPIDFVTSEIEYDENLRPINFINFEPYQHWNISHDGYTVNAFRLKSNAFPVGFEGSDLGEFFELQQFHFHWGDKDVHGSEHAVDGALFALELHLVFKSNSGRFAVVGFIFKVSKEDNLGMTTLLDAIDYTREKGEWTKTLFNMKDFFAGRTSVDKYYRYHGSLTVPPCKEGIIWNFHPVPLEISHDQLLALRNNEVKKNVRQVQRVYGRKVTSSFRPEEQVESPPPSNRRDKYYINY